MLSDARRAGTAGGEAAVRAAPIGAELTAALITHHRAPLAVLERMPRGAALPAALADVVRGLPADGAVALSTCNRFELYLDGPAPVDREALVDRLHAVTGVDRAALDTALDVVRGEAAVRHLFAVAAGLESRLVGEDEILGQVRTAAREAERDGTGTPGLRELFAWAVRTGRRARRAAGLAEGRVSLAARAVEVLDQRLRPLRGRTVLLLGSGHVAGRVVAALREAGAWPVLLVRRPESVSAPGVPVLGLDALPVALDRADAVLCATSAPRPLLTAELLRRAADRRAGRSLVVVDLAVPRNVEAAARGLAGVSLLDLDAVTDGAAGPAFAAATRRASAVVTAEARAFCRRGERSPAGPLIDQVLRHADGIRRAELARAQRLAPSTDPRVLDELTARVVAKLLHAPVTAIREHACAGDEDLAALIAATLAGGEGAPVSAARTRCSGPAARRSPGSAA
jgi:glutamyl-tRNA reductase